MKHTMGMYLLDEGADVAAAPAQDPHRTLVNELSACYNRAACLPTCVYLLIHFPEADSGWEASDEARAPQTGFGGLCSTARIRPRRQSMSDAGGAAVCCGCQAVRRRGAGARVGGRGRRARGLADAVVAGRDELAGLRLQRVHERPAGAAAGRHARALAHAACAQAGRRSACAAPQRRPRSAALEQRPPQAAPW